MYTFGGWSGLFCLNDFWEFSLASYIWYEIKVATGLPPTARYRFDGEIVDSKLYIFGGVNQE
jgi:Galactose oxidase, central domain